MNATTKRKKKTSAMRTVSPTSQCTFSKVAVKSAAKKKKVGTGLGRDTAPIVSALAALLQRVQARVADEVQAPLVGDDRRVLAVVEGPHLLAGARIEPVRTPLERGEVDDPGDDGRGA